MVSSMATMESYIMQARQNRCFRVTRFFRDKEDLWLDATVITPER